MSGELAKLQLVVLYPESDSGWFDFDYYRDVHLPLSATLLKPFGFIAYSVYECQPMQTDRPAPYVVMTELDFADPHDLREGMRIHGPELAADFPRYTNITPVAFLRRTRVPRTPVS